MVPARRPLPVLPPRPVRAGGAACLPGRAGALRLALRHRGGGGGHARRARFPRPLGRVRAGAPRSLRGADGRGPPGPGHRAGVDHPARGAGPPPALVSGRVLRRLLGSRARRAAGDPAHHALRPGPRARRGDPRQRHLRAPLRRRGGGRGGGLLPVLLAVERPLAGGPLHRPPDASHRGGAGHRPRRAARRRLRGLRGAGGPRGDGAEEALARGRHDRGPPPPARRPGLPPAHLAGRAAHRLRAPGGRPTGHRRLGGGPRDAGDERRRPRHGPAVAPRRAAPVLVGSHRHLRPLRLRARSRRLAGRRAVHPASAPSAGAGHPPLPRPSPSPLRDGGAGSSRGAGSCAGARRPRPRSPGDQLPDGRDAAHGLAGREAARLRLLLAERLRPGPARRSARPPPRGSPCRSPASRHPVRPGSGLPVRALRPPPHAAAPLLAPGLRLGRRRLHLGCTVLGVGRGRPPCLGGRPALELRDGLPGLRRGLRGRVAADAAAPRLESMDQLRSVPLRCARGGLDPAARLDPGPDPRTLPSPLDSRWGGAGPSTGP